MGKDLVLVGGGHAHLTALCRAGDYVERGHRVTVVSPADYHYYSGMGPGLLSGIYRPQQARFHVRRLAERGGAEFIRDRAVRIEPDDRCIVLESGGEVRYDVVSFNTGSEVPAGAIADPTEPDVFPVKPIVNLLRARQTILDCCSSEGRARVLVVGGGAAGVELAGNAHRLISDHGADAELTLVSGSELLTRQPERARRLARSSLRRRGVRVLEGAKAQRLHDGEAVAAEGETIPYDVALVAVGVRPSELFRRSGLPTGDDGGLLVDGHLRSVTGAPIFGGGDCISLAGASLERVGVHAVRQNPVLYHNLLVALEGGEPETFRPSGGYLLILNMGDGRGIASKWGLTWDGRPAFRLKDFIDRRFMARYQLCGERDEPAGGIG